MKPRKIVFITSGVQTGGAEKQLSLLAKGLKEHEFEPTIISLSKANTTEILPDFEGLPVIQFNLEPNLGLLKSLNQVRTALRIHKPDILQGWMYAGNIVASITGGGIVPNIYHSVRASNMDTKRYGKQIWLNSKLSAFSKAVTANSQSGAEHHIEKGFPSDKMRVIYNGISIDDFKPKPEVRKPTRKALGLNPDEIVFLYVARVDPMKGHKQLTAAAKLCPEFKLVFVGQGTERLNVPENVITLGTRRDMQSLYNASDWLISWSNYGEGFPNSIAEAMACGLPVCANDSGDSWSIIGDSGNRCIAQTPEELANTLKEIAKFTPSNVEKLKIAQRINDCFSVNKMVSSYIAVYGEG